MAPRIEGKSSRLLSVKLKDFKLNAIEKVVIWQHVFEFFPYTYAGQSDDVILNLYPRYDMANIIGMAHVTRPLRNRKITAELIGYKVELGDMRHTIDSLLRRIPQDERYTMFVNRIYRIIEDPDVVGRAEIDALRALILMDEEGDYIKRIFSIAPPEKGEKVQQIAFVLCARNYRFTPALSDFFMQENQAAGAGFYDLIREARAVPVFYANRKALREMYDDLEYRRIWQWCIEQLKNSPAGEERFRLRSAFLDAPPHDYTGANTMAAVYFTFQLLKPGE